MLEYESASISFRSKFPVEWKVCIAYYLNTSRRKTVLKAIESKENLLNKEKNTHTTERMRMK